MKKNRPPRKETVKSLKKKKILFQILSFFVSIAPIAIGFTFRFDTYVKTVRGGVTLAFGGVLAVALIALKIANKMPKKVHRVIRYGVVFLLVYLLQDLLQDAVLLVGCGFVGEFLDWAIFTIPIRKTSEKIEALRNADALSEKVSANVEKILEEKLRTL